MRRPLSLVPAAAVAAATLLVLTACGAEVTGSPGSPGGGVPQPQGSDAEQGGVRITRVDSVTLGGGSGGVSAAYEVTNSAAEALTYTITFDFTRSGGEVLGNVRRTVNAVGPGRTVKGSVDAADAALATTAEAVKISEVTRVPAAEAPAAPGECPSSGVRVWADEGDAAMGLRIVGLHLENCGTRDYPVDGYPQVTVLDEDLKRIDGVKVFRGSGGISLLDGFDDPPRPVTLKHGESATASLMWRNTTEAGTPVNAPYTRVVAKPGAAPVTVTPHLDLGTTGKLGVSAWKRSER
ncbi:DUF4232 domain-containing protein [Streptomyces sp. NPDC059582]|uniref:DUF4232 domain-containing protein n=1 Tax=Streptomyces sp. NPDC059582 TaxID=3346875 RepID=UPI0036B0D40D